MSDIFSTQWQLDPQDSQLLEIAELNVPHWRQLTIAINCFICFKHVSFRVSRSAQCDINVQTYRHQFGDVRVVDLEILRGRFSLTKIPAELELKTKNRLLALPIIANYGRMLFQSGFKLKPCNPPASATVSLMKV